MTDTQHTPGPWHICEVSAALNRSPLIRDAQGMALAETFRPNNSQASQINRDANARLIAAAPEILDALAEMLADADTLQEPYRNEAVCERARAAIAKATGA